VRTENPRIDRVTQTPGQRITNTTFSQLSYGSTRRGQFIHYLVYDQRANNPFDVETLLSGFYGLVKLAITTA